MSYLTVPRFALAIDWETSGYSTPHYAREHQGISFGAIVFEIQTFEPVEKLYREIKFNPKYKWVSGAEQVHGLTREYLNKHGVTQEAAAEDLGNLVVKYFATDDIILLGHRVHFDKAFTVQLMESLGVELNYHPSSFDSASLGTMLMGISKSEEIFTTLGLPPRQKHNSLEDIEYTLKSCKRMKDLFLLGALQEANT